MGSALLDSVSLIRDFSAVVMSVFVMVVQANGDRIDLIRGGSFKSEHHAEGSWKLPLLEP